MEKSTIEFNANGQPRKRRKDGEYIFRPGRPVTKPGKPVSFRCNIDLFSWLDSHDNKSEYINALIRKDMEENSREEKS